MNSKILRIAISSWLRHDLRGSNAFQRASDFPLWDGRFLGTATVLLMLWLAFPASAQSQPRITRQPVGSSRSLGDQISFRVMAFGDVPIRYQWFFNDTPLPTGTNAILTIANLTSAHAGSYHVRISNPSGEITSDSADLDIDPAFTVMANSAVAKDSGQGMSWVDYDGDGWLDLYCAGESRHLLYRNDGKGSFVRLNNASPLVNSGGTFQDLMGGFWADYDNDGRPDLFSVLGGTLTDKRNELYRNLGGGNFARITDSPLVKVSSKSVMALWGDYDRNGTLDLFVINSAFNNNDAAGNFLFVGDGRGGFTRSGTGAALEQKRAFNGGSAADYDGDGDLDIVVTAWSSPGNVFTVENLEGLEFEHFPTGSYGSFVKSCSWADFDNDGDPDLFVGYEFEPALLLRNEGGGNFTQAVEAGLSPDSRHAYTGAWGDYDNDGWLDLLVTGYRGFLEASGSTGMNPDPRDFLYHNNGDGTFTRVLTGSLVNDDADSITAAWGDYDNDGFLDLAVGRSTWWSFPGVSGIKSALFHNNGNGNSWLMLKLVGTQSNRDAIGAKVFVKANLDGKAVRQFREINAGHGWASQNDIRAHFGLADATQADEIRIEWPSGQVTELKNVPARQILTITEPGGAPQLQAIRTGEGIALTLRGDAGQSYVIEMSNDLQRWKELTVLLGATEPVSFRDVSGVGASRFYRAVRR